MYQASARRSHWPTTLQGRSPSPSFLLEDTESQTTEGTAEAGATVSAGGSPGAGPGALLIDLQDSLMDITPGPATPGAPPLCPPEPAAPLPYFDPMANIAEPPQQEEGGAAAAGRAGIAGAEQQGAGADPFATPNPRT